MIRVLVVESTTFGVDGITNVIRNYYTHMNHGVVEMDLVTINSVDNVFRNELKNNGSNNFVIECRNSSPLRYGFLLYRILKRGNYSIIHVHGCSATMAIEMTVAWLAGVRVRIAHSHNTRCDHFCIDKLLRPLFFIMCNVGFACGESAGKWLFPHKNYIVIQNGIEVEKYQFNESIRKQYRNEYGLNGKTVIGHVGRFCKQKNHEQLVKIVAEYSKSHPNTELVLIGDGDYKPVIENRVKEYGISALFLGTSNEVNKWLQAIDIIVFPSLYEGQPLFLIEAQAAGVPCVLSDSVPSDVKMTEWVEFVGLQDNRWCIVIDDLLRRSDRHIQSQRNMEAIRQANYDIRNNCNRLAELYHELERNSKESVD